MEFKHLEGLIAACHTPFNASGAVDYELIDRQAELLYQNGITGVYISGSTGEGISCTVEERQKVMQRWAKVAKGKMFLIAHIGALALGEVETLAHEAQKCQMDALSVIPANFFKPSSVEMLVKYISQIASYAPTLPFYYYHTVMSGVNLNMKAFLEQADGKIPNLAGIKFNSPDLYEFQNCQRACGGKFDITWGVDEFLAGAIALGAKSAIGSTYNYAAPLYHKIWQDVNSGNLDSARSGMTKVCQIVDILVQYGGIAAGKAMMRIHNLDLGDVRLPLRPLSESEKVTITTKTAEILKGII